MVYGGIYEPRTGSGSVGKRSARLFTDVDLVPSPTFGSQYNNAQYGRSQMSWDRLDPTIGYVPGNVVLCCLWFNKLKSSMSTDQMIVCLEKLLEMRNK